MPLELAIEAIPLKGGADKEFKALVDNIKKELRKELDGSIRKQLEKDMRATVRNWDRAPTFRGLITTPFGGNQIWLTILPKGPGALNWKRVSEGVKGHVIVPRRKKRLVFPAKYDPHTTLRGKVGGPGRYTPARGAAGQVIAKSTRWPGIKPREFSKRVLAKNERYVINKLTKAIDRAVK